MLRELQAEEDDEERFQADLKKAVRQSLGVFPFLFLLHVFFVCDSTLKLPLHDNSNLYILF